MRKIFLFVMLSNCSLATDLSSLSAAGGASDAGDAGVQDVAMDAKPDVNACASIDAASDPKNCGTCGHDCLGGACDAGVCEPVTLASGQGAIGQIAVNGTRVVWSRGRGSTQTGGLFAMKLDGSDPISILESSAFGCGALAIDETNAYVECTDGMIHTCGVGSCGSPTTLTSASNVRALAIDSAASLLYVSIGTPYDKQTGGYVGFVPLSGGSIARLTANDQPNPGSIVLAKGNVYWVNSGTYTSDVFDMNGGVRRASAGTNQSDVVLDRDTSGSDYFGLYVDSTTAYYGAGASHEVHSVALLGGSASKFATNVVTGTAATAIVGDANYVYWAETGSTGGITRCEKSCNHPVQIANDGSYALALTEDATALYWATGTGEIKRLAK